MDYQLCIMVKHLQTVLVEMFGILGKLKTTCQQKNTSSHQAQWWKRDDMARFGAKRPGRRVVIKLSAFQSFQESNVRPTDRQLKPGEHQETDIGMAEKQNYQDVAKAKTVLILTQLKKPKLKITLILVFLYPCKDVTSIL